MYCKIPKTLSELTQCLGSTTEFLYWLSNHIQEQYMIFQIPKKNGKTRTIEAPSQLLKKIQRRILSKILFQRAERSAMAFEKRRNIRKNASAHLGAAVVLCMDVKDFFPSLKFSQVTDYLESLGMQRNVSVLVAKICTLQGHLPQGAVTSPHLSNLLLAPLDKAIRNFCKVKKYHFTRYADDLTISGKMNDEDIREAIAVCKKNFMTIGLKLNPDKTHVMRNGNRKMVTGITVNQKLSAPKSLRKRLRQRMYYLNHFWEKDWHRLTEEELNNLLGLVNFVWSIDRENQEFSQYRTQLLEIKRFWNSVPR